MDEGLSSERLAIINGLGAATDKADIYSGAAVTTGGFAMPTSAALTGQVLWLFPFNQVP